MWVILLAFVGIELFKHFLEWLNLRHQGPRAGIVPPEFEGVVGPETLRKAHSYLRDKVKLNSLESLITGALILLFFFGGLLDWYGSRVSSLQLPFVFSGWLFFMLLYLADEILALPFNFYDVFRLETKYGFTKSTRQLWVLDRMKETVLSALLLTGLVLAGLWFIQRSPHFWWLWFWALFFCVGMILTFLSPYVIEPLFNKFTSLEEGSLKQRIVRLATKAGISARKVLKMDASRRSRHTNAYFTGFGKAKRIVLFDTLLEGMNEEEVLAVLAHEIGHWKRHHVIKSLCLTGSLSLAGFYLLFRATETSFLSSLFHISSDAFPVRATIAALLGSMLVFLVRPLVSAFTRRMEREADLVSVELTGETEGMVDALVKLSKENLSNPYPHPLYVMFYYSHPPVLERIRALREVGKEPSSRAEFQR